MYAPIFRSLVCLIVVINLSFTTIVANETDEIRKEDTSERFVSGLKTAYELSDCKDDSVLYEAWQATERKVQKRKALSFAEDYELMMMPMTQTECQRVSSCEGDAEQYPNGSELVICDNNANISDLDMVRRGRNLNINAMQWSGWTVPAGATITNAYVQFTAINNSTGPAAFTIYGEAADSAALFSPTNDIISRGTTSASINWSPGTWSASDAGLAQQTPDISAIIQEIVDRPGYQEGNPLVLGFTGSGLRHAYSYDIDPDLAPQLCITYEIPEPAPSTCDGCPTINVVSLDGVPNFPTIDLLNLCSSPDTASILIYNAGACQLTDVVFTIDFDMGLSYGGFVFKDPNSSALGSVVPLDLSDLTKPQFSINFIDSTEAFIINVAVQADCEVDIETETDINFDATVDYSYNDINGSSPNCQEVITEVGVYNSGIRVPVLNIRTVSPQDLNISQANSAVCQRVTVSQDGIQAFLDELQFQVSGVDTSVYKIASIDINDIQVPATDYNYDGVTQTVTLTVTSNYFVPNTSANVSDGDMFLETDETFFVDICYEVKGCTDEANFLNYNAFYGCAGRICGDVSQGEGAVNFTPNFGANVVAVSSDVNYGGICGDNLSYDITTYSANTDPVNGLWENVTLKYKACLLNNTSIVGLRLNGVLIPDSIWSINASTVIIDLTKSTTDFDGTGGFSDEDNDGYFDDLVGGNQVTISTELEIGCAADGSACSAIGCTLSQFEVNGLRNCGQDFQQIVSIGGDGPITFSYGANSTAVNDSTYSGYGIPITEIVETTSGVWLPTVNGYEFSYDFSSNNISPCGSGSGDIELVINVLANGKRITDVRYTPNSATYEGDTIFGTTWEYQTVDDGITIDTIGLEIRIPAGDVSIDATGTHDYTFNLDYRGDCYPWDYAYISYKVVETCDDCGTPDPCEIVRACDNTSSYIRWRGTSCECDIRGFIDTLYRTNYGYSDKEMTNKLTIEDVPDVDRRRFLPGDTMYYRAGFAINNAEVFYKANYLWQFYVNPREEAGPIMLDVYNSTFGGWFYKDGATGTITEIGIPDCFQNYPDATRDYYWEPSIGLWNFGVEHKTNTWTNRNDDAYQTCIDDDNVNPNYPPESAINYESRDDSSSDRFTDRQRIYIRFGRPQECSEKITGSDTDGQANDGSDSPCHAAFLEQFPLKDGDTIFFDVIAPVVHNPAYDLEQMNAARFATSGDAAYGTNMFIRPHSDLYEIDPSTCANGSGTSSRVASSCDSSEPYEGHLPGPMTITPDIEVTDCDIEVNYSFTLNNPLPEVDTSMGELPWYQNEYRPYMATEYLELRFPNNMVYLNDGVIIMPDSSEVVIPAQYIDTSFGNLICIPDTSGGVCCTAQDTNALAGMRIVDNDYYRGLEILSASESELLSLPGTSSDLCDSKPLVHVRNDPFPHIPVGGADERLSYGLRYRLSSLCPEDVETNDFELVYQFAEPYIPNLVGRSGGIYRGSYVNTAGEEYVSSYRNRYVINPFGSRCQEAGADDGCIAFYDRIFPHPVGSTGASNPMRQSGTLVANPDQFTDSSLDFPPLIPMLANLLKADLAMQSEFNTYTVCAGDASGGSATHTNVVTSIEVPNSVEFIGATDTLGAPVPWVLSRTLPNSKIYAITMSDLAPEECAVVIIETELLFCPVGLDVDTRICISTVSGCLDPVKASALAALGGSCDLVSACYEYVAEEADLQVEWDPQPTGEYGLCDTITMGVRIKNVKPAVLTTLIQDFWFPSGLEPVPGSWKVIYPGGPDSTGIPMTIPDPDTVSAENTVFGTNYGYDEDGDWSNYIDMNGLPGILAGSDSNKVQIIFEVATICDEFVSGTGVYYKASGADPCEATVESMFVESNPIIIEGANPIDFAQFFVFAEPASANCGEAAQLILTYLNISPLGESKESMVCVDLETSTFNYMTGSIQWLSPESHSPTFSEETSGSVTHVCFNIPDGIGPGEAFQISLDYSIPNDIDCGAQDLGVQVSSEIMDVSCAAQGNECSVQVLNSVNPSIEVDFLPPLDVAEQNLLTKCPNLDGTVDLCYSVTLVNPGMNYNSNVEIALIRDVNLNGIIDDPIIDVILADSTQLVLLNSGDTTTLTGCFTVNEAESCPVFLKVTQTTDCVCDNLDYYYDSIEPAVNEDLRTTYTLCPGTPLGLANCGSWDYAVTPSNGATISLNEAEDSVFVTLNSGYGGLSPVILNVTSTSGGCQSFDFPIELYSLNDFEFGPFATIETCNVGCKELSLNIPSDYESSVTVEWLPNLYLDDNTSLTPTICNPLMDSITYTVTLSFMNDDGSMCMYSADYPIRVLEQPVVNIFEDGNLCNIDQATFTAPGGFSNYEWKRENSDGSVTTVQNSSSNSFTVLSEGTYYVTYATFGAVCETRSNSFSVLNCPEMNKTITSVSPTGNPNEFNVSYDIEVTSTSAVVSSYDIYDKPGFDDDISISSASYSSDAPGITGGALTLPDPIAPGWLLGDNVVIDTATTHTYTIDYIVTIDLSDGVTGDDLYTSCGLGSGPLNASPGQGLYNSAVLDLDEDPTTDEVQDDDCGELPYLVIEKEHSNTVSTGDHCYDISYVIRVSNIGGDTGYYDLVDHPDFDDDFIFTTAEYTTDAEGLVPSVLTVNTFANSFTLADDQSIIAGKVDTFAITIGVCIDLEDASSVGDETLTSCGTSTPGVPTNGEGLFNEVFLDINNDGIPDDTSNTCDDIPYLSLDKQFGDYTVLPDGTIDATFTLRVINHGVNVSYYDLFDLPEYDDDISINSASFSSDVPSNGILSSIVPAAPGWMLADSVSIASLDTHLYTISLNLDLDVYDGIGDDFYSSCGDGGSLPGSVGEGLFNTASLDLGGEGTLDITDEECGDVRIIDVALKKELVTPGLFKYGDVVQFEITVYNQGTAPLHNIEVTDYIRCGYTYNNGSQPWSRVGDNYRTTIPGPVAVGDSSSVSIYLEVTICDTMGLEAFLNIAEVSRITDSDGFDISDEDYDSTPDDEVGNDPGGAVGTPADNDVNGNGTGTIGDGVAATDEDDADPATIPIFDLALTKTIDPTSIPSDGTFDNGDSITYLIRVINQGTVDATDILIYDIFPCGFNYVQADNPGWSAASPYVSSNSDNDMYVETNISNLSAGGLVEIPITFYLKTNSDVVADCMPGEDPYINFAEIESARDDEGNIAQDIDSEAGSDNPEEFGTVPNSLDDNDVNSSGTGDIGSEDDHDPAGIEVFDLALTKMLVPDENPYRFGDIATFEICVTNQGSVPTDSVNIIDYIPSGYVYATSNDLEGWSYDGTNAIYAIDNSELPGGTLDFLEQVCVSIDLEVVNTVDRIADYINIAEISDATTVVYDSLGQINSTVVTSDNDGYFDNMSDNDPGGEVNGDTDDTILGENGDEDDADPARIEVVDFALIKEINSPSGPYGYGDTLLFDIRVYNQGTVSGKDLVITDYVPDGLTFEGSLNSGWSGSEPHTYTITDTIVAGGSIVVPMRLIINSLGSSYDDYVNYAEITSVKDISGVAIGSEDIDSDPDGSNNDPGGEPESGADNELNGDGSGSIGDGAAAGDEDDHDPAYVRVVDLALTKEVATAGPYGVGDTVSFVITVYNQGNVIAENIEVNDYMPTGYRFEGSLNPGWSLQVGGSYSPTYEKVIAGPLGVNSSITDTLRLVVEPVDGSVGQYINIAEIERFTDTSGVDITIEDVDSPGDDDPTNDGGGAVDSDSDDVVAGDGSGAVGSADSDSDEDNADPAQIEIVDFALSKVIMSPSGPYGYGDTLVFGISVINQGTVTGRDIVITDYLPVGLSYVSTSANMGWSSSAPYEYTIGTSLLPGDTIVVPFTARLESGGISYEDYVNYAEITSVNDESGVSIGSDDFDSMPDGINSDAGGAPESSADNHVDGDGSGGIGDGAAAGDEDDHDPAYVRVVDLALTKEVATAGPYGVGDTVSFVITVYNQGNVIAENIEVNDYMPTGYRFEGSLNPGWSLQVGGSYSPTYEKVIAGPLGVNSSITDTLRLVVEPVDGSVGQYINIAEIERFTDTSGVDITIEDVDSPGDDDPTNDGGGAVDSDSDDVVAGDGSGAVGSEDSDSDEDNADPAQIEIVDFALYKEISGPSAPYGYGDTIVFAINIINQGTVTGRDIVIADYIPSGFTFIANSTLNPGWTNTNPSLYTYSGMDLVAGDTAVVEMNLILNSAGVTSSDYTNVAEIVSVNDTEGMPIGSDDFDSAPDMIPDNDRGGLPESAADDVVDGDGSGGIGDGDAFGDEDDSDPAFVEVVDVALLKTVVDGSPYSYGDTVSFIITTINQGSIPVTDLLISDYVPSGFSFDSGLNSDWTFSPSIYWTDTYSMTIGETIYPGGSVMDTIHLILLQSSGGSEVYTNTAEVSMLRDTSGVDRTMDDLDSPGDTDPFNDGGGVVDSDSDDVVDGDGSGAAGSEDASSDEDNADPARVEVIDVALYKTVNSPLGPYAVGDTITYDIHMINQGNVVTENFRVYDFAPVGLTFINSIFVNPGWTGSLVAEGTVSTYHYPPQIAPGDTAVIQIKHVINGTGVDIGDYTNIAEIFSFDDEDGDPITRDIDSTPDPFPNDPGGDPDNGTDDTVNNENGDEDDHDPAIVEIVDMALTKTVVTAGPYAVGDTVQFAIAVYNQGNIVMDSIVVNDYIPSGYEFDASGENAEWVEVNDSLYQTVLTGGIAAKQSDTVYISLVVNPVRHELDEYLNISELSSFADEDGEDRTNDDRDSDADDEVDNDEGGEEGSEADDEVDGDGSGDGGPTDPTTDEDDSDPARIEVVDFALVKRAITAGPYAVGDTIRFEIEVYNQGTVAGTDIVVYDHAPIGLTFDSALNPIWDAGLGSVGDSTTITGPLMPGDSSTVEIVLIANAMGIDAADYTNYAEIGSVSDEEGEDISDEDQDSEPDAEVGNDPSGEPDGPTDDEVDGDGSGDPDNEDPTRDEDDHDPVLIEIVDMALTKTVVTAGPYAVGDTLQFAIAVYNQGNITMDSVVVNDYIPSGYEFDGSGENAEWVEVNDSLYQTVLTGGIAAKQSDTVYISLVVNPVRHELDEYLNISELSSFADEDGEDRTNDDRDSDADDEVDNDEGGEEGSDADDEVDGDGSGEGGPTDPTTDEDDSDPARIEVVDFALVKRAITAGPYAVGDTIRFEIEVYNQGTVAGTDIVVYDHAPIGLTFDSALNPIWDAGLGSGGDSTTITGPLMPGDSSTVEIVLIANAMGIDAADYTNYAEIGSVSDEEGEDISDEDQDSEPDAEVGNDPSGEPDGPTDDEVDGDGSGDPDNEDPTRDEDDHDPVLIEIVDMALTKTVVTAGPYAVGDTIQFAIAVYNQGNITMDSIVVNDYIPSGYEFDGSGANSEWVEVNDSLYQTVLTGGIAAKQSDTVYISLVVNPVRHELDEYLNISELSSFADEDGEDRTDDDRDSDADDEVDNDEGGEEGSDADDEVDGDGSGEGGPTDPTTDEDDSDPARIEVVDFTLVKRAITAGPYAVGDTIRFEIEVYNQGTVAGTDIVVYDHAPIGLTFDSALNPIWDAGLGSGGDSTTITGPLMPDDSSTVEIVLIANAMGIDAADYTNYAEIGSVSDEEGEDISDEDQDSEPDAEVGNDPSGEPDGPTDDEVDGDGSGDPDNEDPTRDEDDHDPVLIEIVDMALTKTVVTAGPYAVGDTIQFAIAVYNQGNITMDSIVVNDYIPSGYEFDGSEANSEWVEVNDSLYQTVLTGGIAAKQSDTVYISLVVNPVRHELDEYLNISELSSFADEDGEDRTNDDRDSDADDEVGNDEGGEEGSDADDEVDGDGSGEGGPTDPTTDEDDSDPARIEVVDFALVKQINSPSGPYKIGDLVTFDITVYNQGTVAGRDIVVYDHVPLGMTFEAISNVGWYEGVGSAPDSIIIAGPLMPGDSATVQVNLRMNGLGSSTADYTNKAEIGSVSDEEGEDISDEDQDSVPDADGDNDSGGDPEGPTDNEVDGDGSGSPADEDPATDEDDEDPAYVRIVDLALVKSVIDEGPYMIGDTVGFEIAVVNQGNVPVSNVLIHDYLPIGFDFDGLLNPGWTFTESTSYGDTYSKTMTGTIAPDEVGRDTMYSIILSVDEATEDMYTNVAEVGRFTDTTDVDISYEDVDSPTDMDPTNDGGGEEDTDSDDSVDGDGSGDPGDEDADTDEDDSDPAKVDVVDFALKKVAVEEGPFLVGETILYAITVYNQGNVSSGEMLIYDHIPAGLDFVNSGVVNPGWTLLNPRLASFTSKEVLHPGDSTTIEISLYLSGSDLSDEGLTNIAEIGGVISTEGVDVTDIDVDSKPDDIVDNDMGGITDSPTDNTIDNEFDDEDDQDPARICGYMFTCPGDMELDESMSCGVVETLGIDDLVMASQCTNLMPELMVRDSLVAENCTGGSHFDERTVIRTYYFMDSTIPIDTVCSQEITYNFDDCNQLTNYGTIAIGVSGGGLGGRVILDIPSGCDVPSIGEIAGVEGGCGYTEYMWLVSTAERTSGQPFIPNSLNTGAAGSGATWTIIPGALGAEYDPGVLTENTYFVRCARDMSCCEFGESNLVGYRINPLADCSSMVPPITATADCDSNMVLRSPTDDMMGSDQVEYKTNETIDASNRVGGTTQLKLDAKMGTTLNPGFEVLQNAALQVDTKGCDN